METVVSGVRPTGNQHLGNYYGAIQNFVKMQNDFSCFFFVADYHSLTTHPNPADLNANVKQILIEYLACGIDPDKATIYIQSDVPQIPELYLIFNTLAYKGELERSVTFKEKARTQPDNVNAGLLTYPVLMAVDIIVHRASKVPVGKDQSQHLEMTRDFAKRFNNLYGTDFFPEPVGFNYNSDLIKIPGLDGLGKMSKSDSDNSAVYLVDEADVIRKKVMRAVSDSGPKEPGEPMSQAVLNLFNLMKTVSTDDKVAFFEEEYQKCTIRYGDMKKELAEDINNAVAPIREKIKEISSDASYIKKITRQGGEKARASAAETLKGARELIGIQYF